MIESTKRALQFFDLRQRQLFLGPGVNLPHPAEVSAAKTSGLCGAGRDILKGWNVVRLAARGHWLGAVKLRFHA
jgi:hypothetical protein